MYHGNTDCYCGQQWQRENLEFSSLKKLFCIFSRSFVKRLLIPFNCNCTKTSGPQTWAPWHSTGFTSTSKSRHIKFGTLIEFFLHFASKECMATLPGVTSCLWTYWKPWVPWKTMPRYWACVTVGICWRSIVQWKLSWSVDLLLQGLNTTTLVLAQWS